MRIFLLYAYIVFAVPVLLTELATFFGLRRSFPLCTLYTQLTYHLRGGMSTSRTRVTAGLSEVRRVL